MTFVVGLSGGIGSGKTVASDRFSELGVPIIDTDIIARQIVEPGMPALQILSETFGADIIQADGTLNRAALRTVAFANAENKAKLDEITHPAIRNETFRLIKASIAPYCIVVVPLLSANSTFIRFMQRVLVVTADLEIKISRIKSRSGLNDVEIQKIMSTQLSDSERREFADDILSNNGSLKNAQKQVDELHKRYISLSTARNESSVTS